MFTQDFEDREPSKESRRGEMTLLPLDVLRLELLPAWRPSPYIRHVLKPTLPLGCQLWELVIHPSKLSELLRDSLDRSSSVYFLNIK